MTEESLADYITRLEQENFALTQESQQKSQTICELEQENSELQRENEILKKKLYRAVGRSITHGEAAEKYWAALEEIRTYLNTLSSIDSDFTSTETYLRINDKIKEVLGNEI